MLRMHLCALPLRQRTQARRSVRAVLPCHRVYNTFEGGAIACRDARMMQRIGYLKNFGFADEVTVVAPGINGKMSGSSTPRWGWCNSITLARALERRSEIDQTYRASLANNVPVLPVPVVA